MEIALLIAVNIALLSSMYAIYKGYKVIVMLSERNDELMADIELLTWMDTDDDLI
jgi:hypothetical protein